MLNFCYLFCYGYDFYYFTYSFDFIRCMFWLWWNLNLWNFKLFAIETLWFYSYCGVLTTMDMYKPCAWKELSPKCDEYAYLLLLTKKRKKKKENEEEMHSLYYFIWWICIPFVPISFLPLLGSGNSLEKKKGRNKLHMFWFIVRSFYFINGFHS